MSPRLHDATSQGLYISGMIQKYIPLVMVKLHTIGYALSDAFDNAHASAPEATFPLGVVCAQVD